MTSEKAMHETKESTAPTASCNKSGPEELAVEMVQVDTPGSAAVASVSPQDVRTHVVTHAMLTQQLAEFDRAITQRVAQQLAQRDEESALRMMQRDQVLMQQLMDLMAQRDARDASERMQPTIPPEQCTTDIPITQGVSNPPASSTSESTAATANVTPKPPHPWIEVFDCDDQVYYHNTETDETSWDVPLA
jgi:hypothetical protein